MEKSVAIGAEKFALIVCEENKSAIGLYEKFGFEVEGKLKNNFKLDSGRLVDELIMAKFPNWQELNTVF